MGTKGQAALQYDWRFWGRPEQLPPTGSWLVWVIKSGRGFGKTSAGAHWAVQQAQDVPKSRGALVGKTPADYRGTMIEGEAGIMACSPPWFRPTFEPTKRRLTWPNGSQTECFSGETPDALRGPQHQWAWVDELAKFKYPQATWDNLMLGLRLGEQPRCMVTTTPRPIETLKRILMDPATVVTGGSTYENLQNLAPAFAREILRQYEGTRLGRQELHGEILTDTPGALWTHARLDRNRVAQAPELTRVVVAIDPAATSDEESAETGLVVAGLGVDGQGYLLGDDSGHYTPDGWGGKSVELYQLFGADRIIGEANNGGEMVGHTVQIAARDRGMTVRYLMVHASRGKVARAEPVAALDEQGRIHMVGSHPELEDQLASWLPGMKSPDRLDAMVWAFTDLLVNAQPALEFWGGGIEPQRTPAEQEAADRERQRQAAEVVSGAIRQTGIYWPSGR